MALETKGLTAENTIDGLGLVTNGFIWSCASIWGPAFPSITTTWVSCISGGNVEACID